MKDRRTDVVSLFAIALLTVASIVVAWPPSTTLERGLDLQGGVSLTLTVEEEVSEPVTSEDMEQVQDAVQKQLGSLARAGATVQRQGNNSLLIQIPGAQTAAEIQRFERALAGRNLPVELSYSEIRSVGPTLGEDSLTQSLQAILVGVAVFIIYLLAFYRGSGTLVISSMGVFSLLYFGALSLASRLGVFTLSLPSLAGIALTVGIAADSSILMVEKIRYELKAKTPFKDSLLQGARYAVKISVDADILALIPAIALLAVAVGPIRGFGLALALGVICDIVAMLLFKVPLVRILAQSSSSRMQRFLGALQKEESEEEHHA